MECRPEKLDTRDPRGPVVLLRTALDTNWSGIGESLIAIALLVTPIKIRHPTFLLHGGQLYLGLADPF